MEASRKGNSAFQMIEAGKDRVDKIFKLIVGDRSKERGLAIGGIILQVGF